MKYERPIINISMFDFESVSANGDNPAPLMASDPTLNVTAATTAAQGVLSNKKSAKALVVIQFNN